MKPLIANRKKKVFLRVFNLFTSLLLFPQRLFQKKINLEEVNPTNVLLVRLDYIGDVVMTSPTFPLLKQRFPDATISLLTSSIAKQLLQGDKNIDNIYVFNWPWGHLRKNAGFNFQKIKTLLQLILQLRRNKFDLVVDFRGDIRFLLLFGVFIGAKVKLSNSRSGNNDIPDHTSAYDMSKHEVERTQDVIRCLISTAKYEPPRIHVSRRQEAEAVGLIEKTTGLPFSSASVVVAPFSSKDIKSWPEAYFKQVISYLSGHYTVFVVGTPEDESAANMLVAQCGENVFSLAGKTSIVQLASVTKLCSLVVGIDTGVLHIASCFSKPIVAIFGPTRSIEYRPYSPFCTVVENRNCVCDQFTHARCDIAKDGYAGCMHDLNADAVIHQLSKIISLEK